MDFFQPIRNEAGRQNELIIILAIVGILLAVAIPILLRILDLDPAALLPASVLKLITAVDQFVPVIAVLGVGTMILSILVEFIGGLGPGDLNASRLLADLLAYKIMAVLVVGGALFFWYGWISTGIILGADGVFCLLSGLYYRRLLKGVRLKA